jgi:DNA-binding response OmpR family regulator
MTEAATKITNLNTKPKVLILEDDLLYSKVLDYQLRSTGLCTIVCNSSEELFKNILSENLPDVFILDFNLGKGAPTGLEVCRKVKAYCGRPVVMLTGDNNVETLVSCLSAGAEQYIVKPCDIRELVARVEVTLRNYQLQQKSESAPLELRLDENIKLSWTKEGLVHNDGRSVKLSQFEMGLVELILKEPNRYIERDKAFFALYGYQMEPTNRSVDLLVSRIRKKMESLGSTCTIKSLRGHGYVLSSLP